MGIDIDNLSNSKFNSEKSKDINEFKKKVPRQKTNKIKIIWKLWLIIIIMCFDK